MKTLNSVVLSGLFCLNTGIALADDAQSADYYNQQMGSNTQDLVKYLKNLGGYLGYDLTQFDQPISQQLLNGAAMQLAENYLYITSLGAIPVNASSQLLSAFVPNNTPGVSSLNTYANMTFSSQPYNNPAGVQQGKISVVQSVDQANYQQDPVSQGVLNMLATPDLSYCLSNDGSAMLQNCNYLVQSSVLNNIIGSPPDPRSFFSYNYNQQMLSQLNGNTLISPLMYSTQSSSADNTSSGNANQGNSQGLVAQNQAQAAANFIRYASSLVTPPNLPSMNDYSNMYLQAINSSGNVTQVQQTTAQTAISNYLANLRSYAAQTSVGLSNLYYILSRRMPQNLGGNNTNATSAALSEFNMATWRLYNPDMSPNKQWMTQMNQASSATVQKEMASLLAEINYQLYLNRQQEERILLTNTILLLQNAKAAQPSPQLTVETGNSSSTQ